MTINFKSSVAGNTADLDQLLIRKSPSAAINYAFPAWGIGNSSNLYGGLGDGTTISTGKISSPVYVSSHGPYKQMVREYQYTYGLRYDNTLWCWGYTYSGIEAGAGISTQTFLQTGLSGITMAGSLPVQVGSRSTYYSNAYIPTYWNKIASGPGGLLAIASDGGMWTFGGTNVYYVYGSGYGGGSNALAFQAPVKIGTDSWVDVSVGYDHYLGIKSDKTLYAWGRNSSGQVGDGTTLNKYISPLQIGTSSWTAISAGTFHTAAIRSDGALFTWGYNVSGQLGDSTTTDKSSPVQIGTSSWSVVSMGYRHTAAIKIDGTLWAWGYNASGQLGDGTTVDKSSPVQIGTLTTWIDVKATSNYSTVALKNDGTLWMWGDGVTYDRIPDGATIRTSRSSPVQIAAGHYNNIIYTSN